MNIKERDFLLRSIIQLSYTMEDTEMTEGERISYAIGACNVLYNAIDNMNASEPENIKIIGGVKNA